MIFLHRFLYFDPWKRVIIAAALAVLGVFSWARPALAVKPADAVQLAEEIRFAREWADHAFSKPRQTGKSQPDIASIGSLNVLSKSSKVLKNRSAWDMPLNLAGKQYPHGLYTDAPAVVQVRLQQPAAEFTALVGIDQNESTQSQPEAASARFHVVVDGKRVFSTPIVKLTSKPIAIKVALEGASEFSLEVDDGGDGKSFDQCTWADARIKLVDGTSLWLDQIDIPQPGENHSTAPFSFRYGGQASASLLPNWVYEERRESIPSGQRRIISYKDPKTGLFVECHVTTYADSAAIDWVYFLKNTSTSDTPIIERFLPLDTRLFKDAGQGPFTLRWTRGDRFPNTGFPDGGSFLPTDEPLEVGQVRDFATRSSTNVMPFFNLQGPGGGWILAVGWDGLWQAAFQHETKSGVSLLAGMQTTHFKLKPGEQVRTPRIAMLRWNGDRMIRGHNQFRQLVLRHYSQQRDGKPAPPPVAFATTPVVYLRDMQQPNEENQLALIEEAAPLGVEAFWLDAYWFPQPWHKNLGNWYPRPKDFPRGLRPLADSAHQHGMDFILWFAPIVVQSGTQWANEYPHFFTKDKSHPFGSWKLGNSEARQFLIDWVSQRIQEWGVDIYREDQREAIPKDESLDRVGIAEMKHLEGRYKFWSELLRRNPGLLIDSCCGGGNRISLETTALSFPLWRSDHNDISEGMKGKDYWPRMGRADQVMVSGLSLYLPFHTGPAWDMRPYSFRSAMSPGIVIYNDIASDQFPTELAKRAIAELKELRPLFLGNIYPLMKITTSQENWYAYQLHREDLSQGCAFFFRRPDSPEIAHQVELSEIDLDATYLVSLSHDTYEIAAGKKMSGRELFMTTVQIDSKPGSALLRYQKIPKKE